MTSSPLAEQHFDQVEQVLAQLGRRILGQTRACQQLLIGFLAGGHVLIEGIPGIGKTRLARAFSDALGLEMKRAQFTPDLMPADITGSNVFDPSNGEFHLIRGPVFSEILMADEINRTPPKTQSALLEAMQERQVTIDGETHLLADVFFVIATQNPIELEGTYPLPEAQADRFLLRVDMGLPEADAELDLYRLSLGEELTRYQEHATPVMARAVAEQLRRAARSTHVSDDLLQYLYSLARAVRQSPQIDLGPSPRGALALLEAARAMPLLERRDFVLPDDLQRLVLPAWGHRVRLTAEAEIEGHTVAQTLEQIVAGVAVPRSG